MLKQYLHPESAGPVAPEHDVFSKRTVLGKLDPLAQKAAQEKAIEENRAAVAAAAERKRKADEERQAKLEVRTYSYKMFAVLLSCGYRDPAVHCIWTEHAHTEQVDACVLVWCDWCGVIGVV